MREQQIGLTSPSCRTPPSQSAGTRWAHPGALHKRPGFDVTSPSNDTSPANPAYQHRRACAPSSRSPPGTSTGAFSASLTTTVFNQCSTRWFEASPAGLTRRADPQGDSEGRLRRAKPSSTRTAPNPTPNVTAPSLLVTQLELRGLEPLTPTLPGRVWAISEVQGIGPQMPLGLVFAGLHALVDDD
jgi:hypothetical protein